jgi:hypothetical protein
MQALRFVAQGLQSRFKDAAIRLRAEKVFTAYKQNESVRNLIDSWDATFASEIAN